MLRDNALLLEALIQYCESQPKTGNLARLSNRAIWLICGSIHEGRTWKINITHLKLLCCLGSRIRCIIVMHYCEMWEMLSCKTLSYKREKEVNERSKIFLLCPNGQYYISEETQPEGSNTSSQITLSYITHFKTSSCYLYMSILIFVQPKHKLCFGKSINHLCYQKCIILGGLKLLQVQPSVLALHFSSRILTHKGDPRTLNLSKTVVTEMHERQAHSLLHTI